MSTSAGEDLIGMTESQRALRRHVAEFFAGHEISDRFEHVERVRQRVPGYRCLSVSPGDRFPLFTYVSLGCWDAVHQDQHGSEFVLVAGEDSETNTLRMAMNAYYHCSPDPAQRLDLGHTVPIGEPWLPGAKADHLLVSSPYPLGSDFEFCRWDRGHARLLWLLPITQAERDFKAAHGLDALEERFEAADLAYWDPGRPSVL